MSRGLTARQHQVLESIVSYRKKHGLSPTLRILGVDLGITSLRGVTVHLDALSTKGYLRKLPGVTRGIVPTEEAEDLFAPPPENIISLKQLDDMLHALGQFKTPKRADMGWRNHYYCIVPDPSWQDLVAKGLADRFTHEDGQVLYRVSEFGLQLLGVTVKEGG